MIRLIIFRSKVQLFYSQVTEHTGGRGERKFMLASMKIKLILEILLEAASDFQ
jgi:hypothetical protein